MKRSDINAIYQEAKNVFQHGRWSLPPHARWDVTDCGTGDFSRWGLALVNLAEEPEYCEKLIYMRANQAAPAHTHRKKKEDIICRCGELTMQLWSGPPLESQSNTPLSIKRSGEWTTVRQNLPFTLAAGERVTLVPGIYHSFWPTQPETIIGEVSTANDDTTDNIFADLTLSRFPRIDEDEPPAVRLVSDH